MNKLVFLLGFVFVVSTTSFTQDIIVKKDSSIIKVKITEVSKGSITYKKANYPDGPAFQIKKNKIKRIEYGNGDITILGKKKTQKSKRGFIPRNGLNMGLYYTPGVNKELNSGSNPVFANSVGLNIKYYFNNNWGIKTGFLYQVINTDENSLGERNYYSDYGYENDNGENDAGVSAIGIPIHAIYTGGKKLGVNFEIGVSYFYPLNSPTNNSTAFLDNILFTAETLLGGSYRFGSRFSIDAGVLLQVDLANYTGQKNKNNLFSGLQVGLNYKIGK